MQYATGHGAPDPGSNSQGSAFNGNRAAMWQRLVVLLLPTLVVVFSVGLTATIAAAVQDRSIRGAVSERVMETAESMASLNQVRDALSATDSNLPELIEELQPLATLVENATGADFVVIADRNGIRVTHPVAAERGGPTSTDQTEVLRGDTYLGTQVGFLGETLRAKVPVRDRQQQIVGVLSVGILESHIADEKAEARRWLYPWVGGALVLGTLASSIITRQIYRRLQTLSEAALEADGLRRTAMAMQEQSHEFSTQLHVIHGLVSHGDHREALDYISTLAPVLNAESDAELLEQPLLRAAFGAQQAEFTATGTRLRSRVNVRSVVDEEVVLVITNLCRNAAEAGAKIVELSIEEEGNSFVVSVEDDGPGISRAHATQVFNRGFSTKVPGESLGSVQGIGLDIVRRTVVRRGGKIELGRSVLGGACFLFDMRVM